LHPNPFVETTLSYVLTYIATLSSSPIIHPSAITILADDAYYTQAPPSQPPSTVTSSTSSSTTIATPVPLIPETFHGQRFKYFGLRLWEAHKTGLGSSAALVTALTASLLAHYLPKDLFDLDTKEGQDELHRLAQTAHCAAQGKVGSGFDVASAVYGTCMYRRFSPSLLEQLGSVGSKDFSKRLHDLILKKVSPNGDEWDAEIKRGAIAGGVKMPQGLRLIMADVDCGSKTPGMVKQVLSWRKSEPDEANMLWTGIHAANLSIGEELSRLSEKAAESDEEYAELTKRIERVRHLIREMSRLSAVPIEPEQQTKLLDALSSVKGVVGGVVPGAGGFDALSLLVRDDKSVIKALDSKIQELNGEAKAGDSRVSLLTVREDDKGIKLEDPALYDAWIIRREDSKDSQDLSG
jgi:phosphomevalonate kinase